MTCSLPVSEYEPSGPIEWVGEAFFWSGFVACDGRTQFALMRQTPGQPAEMVIPMGGPELCRGDRADELTGLGEDKNSSVRLSGTEASVIDDHGTAFENCHFARARLRASLEASGFTRVSAAASGIRLAEPEDAEAAEGAEAPENPPGAPLLGCRQLESGATEILFFEELGAEPARFEVDWPLANDSPMLMQDPETGDWLIYPLLSFRRREALKGSLPGVPVGRLRNGKTLDTIWLPWSEETLSGAYRVQLGPVSHGPESLIVAIGRADEHDGAGLWQLSGGQLSQLAAGDIDVESMVRGNNQVAWRERVRTEETDGRHGKFRFIIEFSAV